MTNEVLRGQDGEIQFASQQRTCTAAGSPEKIREATEYLHNKVVAFEIRAHETNTGNLYFCNEKQVPAITTSGRIVGVGETWGLDVSHLKGKFFDLSKIWFDSDTSGDGFSYSCVEVQ